MTNASVHARLQDARSSGAGAPERGRRVRSSCTTTAAYASATPRATRAAALMPRRHTALALAGHPPAAASAGRPCRRRSASFSRTRCHRASPSFWAALLGRDNVDSLDARAELEGYLLRQVHEGSRCWARGAMLMNLSMLSPERCQRLRLHCGRPAAAAGRQPPRSAWLDARARGGPLEDYQSTRHAQRPLRPVRM